MRELASAEKVRAVPVSHGGSLDPFAEGLLLVLVGQATRFLDLFHAVPKTYVAEVCWGIETDSGDPLGTPVAEGDASGLTAAALDAALAGFIGWTDQVPPTTSAKKVEGEPAYARVHRGESVALPPSRVYLHRARWLKHDPGSAQPELNPRSVQPERSRGPSQPPRTSRLELECRGGFYVRALARDLGRKLGVPAHLKRLSRTHIGPWRDPGPEGHVEVPGTQLLPWCSSRTVTPEELRSLRRGRPIARGALMGPAWKCPDGFPDPEGPVRAYLDGALVALLDLRDHQLRLDLELRPGL